MTLSSQNFTLGNQDTLILFQDGSKRSEGFYEYADNANTSYLIQVRNGEEDNLDIDKIIDCKNHTRVELVSTIVNTIQGHQGRINIDISILSRYEFLFLLRMVYEAGRYEDLRILYSEPEEYSTDSYQETPVGIEKISSIPGYANNAPLNRKLLLILLLGYEPARSMAIYDHIDPDETYLIVPDPPYHSDWEGKTERMNAGLIDTVKSDNIFRLHSSDPTTFRREFENVVKDSGIDIGVFNCRISPLSTKPQSLGLFDYWRENRGDFSLIYSTPLTQKKLYDSVGIGDRYILKEAE